MMGEPSLGLMSPSPDPVFGRSGLLKDVTNVSIYSVWFKSISEFRVSFR